MQIGIAMIENSMEVPQKSQIRDTTGSSIPTAPYISKGNKITISKNM
jgi:hypothetical protein